MVDRPFIVLPTAAAVDATALFALPDLSFQHPTLLVAAAPVQPEEASTLEESAPSSHSLNDPPVMIALG